MRAGPSMPAGAVGIGVSFGRGEPLHPTRRVSDNVMKAKKPGIILVCKVRLRKFTKRVALILSQLLEESQTRNHPLEKMKKLTVRQGRRTICHLLSAPFDNEYPPLSSGTN